MKHAIVVVKIAIRTGKIFKAEGTIPDGFNMLAAIGVEGADEINVAFLAEHDWRIEAAATGDSPGME